MPQRKRSSVQASLALAAMAGVGLMACAAERVSLDAPSPIQVSMPESCMSLPAAATVSVRWARSDGAGATTPRGWCESVGPVVTVEAAGDGAPQAIEKLVVVTWNVHAGGGDLVRFVADLRGGALTGAPVESFVLLLQEAYRAGPDVPEASRAERLTARVEARPPTGPRTDIGGIAEHLGLYAFYAPSMPNGSDSPDAHAEDRGNAILSTLPLSGLAAVELPFEVQRRVAVAASLEGTTADGSLWRLRVASGHLDTRSRWSRVLDSFGAGRARQAGALGAWLDGEAVILGADLNTWSAGMLEGALDLLYDRFPETPPAGGATFTAAGVLGRKLDHLLVRLPPGHETRVHRIPDRYGSDHHPLLGVVRFPASGATLEARDEDPRRLSASG
jgi:endonuclease/exonuclease/phosphatase family metal-dependent hydrolase